MHKKTREEVSYATRKGPRGKAFCMYSARVALAKWVSLPADGRRTSGTHANLGLLYCISTRKLKLLTLTEAVGKLNLFICLPCPHCHIRTPGRFPSPPTSSAHTTFCLVSNNWKAKRSDEGGASGGAVHQIIVSTSTSLCVCVCVFVYVCMCLYINVCLYVCMYVCVGVYPYTCSEPTVRKDILQYLIKTQHFWIFPDIHSFLKRTDSCAVIDLHLLLKQAGRITGHSRFTACYGCLVSLMIRTWTRA